MRPVAYPALALLALVGVSLSGCTTNCQELAHRICECIPAGTQRNNCNDSVDRQLSEANPNEDYCASKLATCVSPPDESLCDYLRSTAGKEACGYAY
jgi:hypothetical protein